MLAQTSLLILALQSCGLAYCIRAQKHLAALKKDKQQNMSSWATFSPSGDIIQSVLAYTYLAIGQGLLPPI